MLSAKLGGKFDRYIVKFFPKGIPPNAYTLTGLFFTVIAGFLLALGQFVAAGIFIFLSGLCDMVDGAMARTTGQASLFGGFLDSVIDRYADLFILFGIGFYYYRTHNGLLLIATLLVIAGSILTSYARARAEVFLKQKCNVGVIERPERIILLGLGALFKLMPYVIVLLAILSNITVFQRIYFVWKKTRTTC